MNSSDAPRADLRARLLVIGLFATALHAEAAPVGRVLTSAGEVTAVRAGAVVKLDRNATIEVGDTIQTGQGSNAQLRLTDGSIIALRPDTHFAIENYVFTGTPGSEQQDKGFFALLKGGLRTVTGLIGKTNRDAYALRTSTATVGIRGTNFNLVLCAPCFNPDGSRAPDGLYGGVIEGAIVLRNQAQETQFGKDDVFFVRDSNTASQRLIAPPQFLRDRLEGQTRSRGQTGQTQQAANNGQGGNQQQNQGTGGGTGGGSGGSSAPPSGQDSNPPTSPQTSNPVQTTQNLTQGGTLQALGTTSGTSTTPTGAGIGRGDGSYPQAGVNSRFLAAEWNGGSSTNALDSVATTDIVVDSQGIARFWNSFVRNSAQVFEGGADGGAIAWGRWATGTMAWAGYGNLSFTSEQGNHVIYGVVPTSFPALDGVSFSLIGATRPTEAVVTVPGNVWSVTGGSLTVNFLSQTFSGNLGLNLNATAGTSAYNFTFANAASLAVSSTTSLSGTVVQTSGAQNVCVGSCNATGTLIFAGTAATHAGAAYQFTTNANAVVQGVAVFKR